MEKNQDKIVIKQLSRLIRDEYQPQLYETSFEKVAMLFEIQEQTLLNPNIDIVIKYCVNIIKHSFVAEHAQGLAYAWEYICNYVCRERNEVEATQLLKAVIPSFIENPYCSQQVFTSILAYASEEIAIKKQLEFALREDATVEQIHWLHTYLGFTKFIGDDALWIEELCQCYPKAYEHSVQLLPRFEKTGALFLNDDLKQLLEYCLGKDIQKATPIEQIETAEIREEFVYTEVYHHQQLGTLMAKANEILQTKPMVIIVGIGNLQENPTNVAAINALIDQQMIAKIISFPEHVARYTCSAGYVIVLERNQDVIEFIEASEMFQFHKGKQSFKSDGHIVRMNVQATDYHQEYVTPLHYLVKNETTRLMQNPKKSLGEMTTLIKRGNEIAKNELVKQQVASETAIELIRAQHIEAGFIQERIFLSELPKHDGLVLVAGDILLTRVNTKIDVALYTNLEKRQSFVDANLVVIRCDTNQLLPEYLLYFLQSQQGKAMLEPLYTGTTRIKNLAIKELKKQLIYVPTMQRQRQVIDQFNQNRKKIERTEQQLKELKEIQQTKLAELFDE
ncbi:MAG: restriction endonuclease subunit S [Culicoidibacterales bacterium]